MKMPGNDIRVPILVGTTKIDNVRLDKLYELLPELNIQIVDPHMPRCISPNDIGVLVELEPPSISDGKPLTDKEKKEIIENAIKMLLTKMKEGKL